MTVSDEPGREQMSVRNAAWMLVWGLRVQT
jgi:hypothetical protein